MHFDYEYYSCVQSPVEVESHEFVRRLISKLEMPCPECGESVPLVDRAAHRKKFCLNREESDLSEVKDLQKVRPPASTASERNTSGEMEENAIGMLKGKLFSSHQNAISKVNTNDWRTESKKLESLVAFGAHNSRLVHFVIIVTHFCDILPKLDLSS